MYCFACRKITKGLSYHVFPSNPEHRSKWLTAFGLEEIDLTKGARICNRHFEESCFKKVDKRKLLMKGAMPTLCIDKRALRSKLYFDSDISSEEENDNSIDMSESSQVMESDRVVKIDNHVEKLEIYAENGSSAKIKDIPTLHHIQRQSKDTGNKSHATYDNGKMSLADHSYCGSLNDHEVGNRIVDQSIYKVISIVPGALPRASSSQNRQNMRNPLQVSQIERRSNFATPNPIRKQYNMAKDEIRRLKHKVKVLFKTVSCLNNKLSNLQLLLQDKRQISEES